jgi:DNA-binding response OmpR family regulator
VIDDDPHAFPIEILRQEGYNIDHWAEVQSLAKLEDGEYDIIILDIGGIATKLTASDGLGILEHLKEKNPSQVIVAFSGQSFDIQKSRFFKLADDVLAKPAEPLKCKQVIDLLLETKFTFDHMWKAIAEVLRIQHVPDATIGTLARQVRTAIRRGEKPDYVSVLKKALNKAEEASRIAGLLARIVAFFS